MLSAIALTVVRREASMLCHPMYASTSCRFGTDGTDGTDRPLAEAYNPDNCMKIHPDPMN